MDDEGLTGAGQRTQRLFRTTNYVALEGIKNADVSCMMLMLRGR